ncbi:hypothetical protein [Fusobacterium ulcerans]|uniref:hypothetical protein n=1 Tax=Fusobacterium ulcerans TaxID=861 RepID=UPI002E7A0F02|nr:hypothetical protein [Fusobacterium ulcerans]MEE0139313.1 hypothetical protein [Fusobacterium ulcerans]
METIQEIFNNREIAIGFWMAIAIVASLFTKPMKNFLKLSMSILFCKKFVFFYFIFLGYFSAAVCLLYKIGFWDSSLLKDTVFWIIFVELPLFAKTIDKAKNNHFFVRLIKENLTFIVVIEFVLNFWTFNLLAEMIIVPVSVIIGALFALSSMEKKYEKVKNLLNVVYLIFGLSVIVNTINSLLNNPMDLIGIHSLKTFLLPFLLLLLNFPVVYGLGLYNAYEQVFIRLKGDKSEQRKMKLSLILFSGIRLSKITAVCNNLMWTTVISLTNSALKKNLEKLQQQLNYQVGENYMKRAKIYCIGSILGLLVSVIGIVACNSQVSLKDILTFNFILDTQRVKEVATYIFSGGVVVSIVLFVISLGLKRKKHEEISNVKKYALYDLLYLIKRQNGILQEFVPIESPKELYIQYILFAYELKDICDNNLGKYENLLTTWELDTLKQLQTYLDSVIYSIKISSDDFCNYSIDDFCDFFTETTKVAPQNEKINTYLYGVKKSIEEYGEQIRFCTNEFKNILP